ncbi:MAG: glycosyltransferase family 4 protein [Ferruginibacter sp.]
MKIVFVLHHDFKSNSGLHVYHYANALMKVGHSVTVAVPFGKDSCKEVGLTPAFSTILFDDLLSQDNENIDIIHVWTPREIVRKFSLKLKDKCKKAKLIIHLEDNEESILKQTFGVNKIEDIRHDQHIPDHLSHPIYYREFLSACDGVTILMDTLSEFVPQNIKPQMIWPIIDVSKFNLTIDASKFSKKYNINEGDFVIAYIGNVHPANYKEVRSLYLAVALAHRQGIPIKLLRTGVDHYDFFEDKSRWDSTPFVELGFVSYKEIPIILNLSDALIQPGEPNSFNNYRLPSKVPEFLMTGKPVVLPHTNLAKYMKEDVEAIFLKKGDALEILSKIKLLISDRELGKAIGKNGLNFAKKNFDERANGLVLSNYYQQQLINKSPTTNQ